MVLRWPAPYRLTKEIQEKNVKVRLIMRAKINKFNLVELLTQTQLKVNSLRIPI